MEYIRGLKYWTDEEKQVAQEEEFCQQCERERNSPDYVPPRPRVKFWRSPKGWWNDKGDYDQLFIGFPVIAFILLLVAIGFFLAIEFFLAIG